MDNTKTPKTHTTMGGGPVEDENETYGNDGTVYK
jgi:hypothetical protein